MQIAYLDCSSGISGDMLLGAMIDAGIELAAIQAGIDSLGLPSCRLATTEVAKHGFRALQLSIEHEQEHTHRHLSHILAMIHQSELSDAQQQLAERIFRRLAEAEAKVHGTTVEKVHFHEVGAVDSIADIVGSAIAWDLLGAERIVCSPVPTGTGFVEIAHGRCAIPAPATGELLKGIPIAASNVEGELTTPTGAAIVGAVADEFGPLPAMTIGRIGYGAGQHDFGHPNLLRLVVGESVPVACLSSATTQPGSPDSHAPISDSIVLLETNLDDTPGEQVGHCVEQLWQAGALDVTVAPLQMKKGRPGVQLSVQCTPADAERLAAIVFRETTTLGLRRSTIQRITLPRQRVSVDTPWGEVAGIVAWLPDSSQRFSPEYADSARLARKSGATLSDVYAAARQAYAARSGR